MECSNEDIFNTVTVIELLVSSSWIRSAVLGRDNQSIVFNIADPLVLMEYSRCTDTPLFPLCHSAGTTSLQCATFLFLPKNAVKYLYTIYIWCFCN